MDQLAWVWPVPILVLAVWLAMRVRRDVQGRSRWLLYPVVGVLALLAVGGAVETVIEATDGSRSADGGELVDVGGHKLFIACSGTGARPSSSRAASARVRTTSRSSPRRSPRRRGCAPTTGPATAGASPQPGPQDGPAIARDLHALLAASGNHGPYILAGHSAGGVYVRFFAAAYPDEVAGVVLLDAMSPHATPVRSAAQSAENPIEYPLGDAAGPRPRRRRPTRSSVGSSDLPAEVDARRHAAEATPRAASSFG